MTAINPEMFSDDDPKVQEVEAEIRDFVRRDVTQLRRPTGEPSAEVHNINSLVQRVAGTSLREIEGLLRELESLRDLLHEEGERVQREISGYARLSEAAMNSTRVIAESVAHCRRQVETTRAH
jgi:hypothetical protein